MYLTPQRNSNLNDVAIEEEIASSPLNLKRETTFDPKK